MSIDSYQDIQGWFDFERLYEDAVFGVIPESCGYKGSANFLEIGTWLGKSTAYLAGLIKFFRPKCKLYAVDTFKGDATCEFQSNFVKKNDGDIFHLFWDNMMQLGVSEFITPIRSPSLDAVRHFPQGIGFDFIFLDTEHTAEETAKSLELYWSLLNDGGIFAGHDIARPQIQEALYPFCQKNGLPLFFEGNSSFVTCKRIADGKPTIVLRDKEYQRII